MGEIADMMIDGLLDEETGEYVGDLNEDRYGTAAPGFPLSYEREGRENSGESERVTLSLPRNCEVVCPHCGRRVRAIGIQDHVHNKHGEDL